MPPSRRYTDRGKIKVAKTSFLAAQSERCSLLARGATYKATMGAGASTANTEIISEKTRKAIGSLPDTARAQCLAALDADFPPGDASLGVKSFDANGQPSIVWSRARDIFEGASLLPTTLSHTSVMQGEKNDCFYVAGMCAHHLVPPLSLVLFYVLTNPRAIPHLAGHCSRPAGRSSTATATR